MAEGDQDSNGLLIRKNSCDAAVELSPTPVSQQDKRLMKPNSGSFTELRSAQPCVSQSVIVVRSLRGIRLSLNMESNSQQLMESVVENLQPVSKTAGERTNGALPVVCQNAPNTGPCKTATSTPGIDSTNEFSNHKNIEKVAVQLLFPTCAGLESQNVPTRIWPIHIQRSLSWSQSLGSLELNECSQTQLRETAAIKPQTNIPTTPRTSSLNIQIANTGARPAFKPAVKLSLPQYCRIRQLIPTPDVSVAVLDKFCTHVFHYLLQRVKFGGCSVLSAARISALVQQQTAASASGAMPGFREKRSVKNIEPDVDKRKYPVSKLDCVIHLLTQVDNVVASELLLQMSQFPMAFPLVTLDRTTSGKYHVFLSLMRGIPLKWEISSGRVVEHSLFINGCKTVLAVRIGNNKKGKSAILNQLLAKEYTFSSKEESEYGKPNSLDGCVEMIWMTQETCKDIFWDEVLKEHYNKDQNEILILANLHGDALDHKELIRFLGEFCLCGFVVFVMPNCTDEMWTDFQAVANQQTIQTIYVDDPDCESEITVDDPRYINTSDLTSNSTMRKVRKIIKEVLRPDLIPSVVNLGIKEWDEDKYSNINTIHAIVNSKSSQLVDLVSDYSCQKVKGAILSCISAASQCQQSINSSSLNSDELLDKIALGFTDILRQQSQDDVLNAVIHLGKELTRLSVSEAQDSRTRLHNLTSTAKRERSSRASQSKPIDLTLTKEIGKEAKKVEDARLSVEHFFRLLGHVYESAQRSLNKKDYEIVKRWSLLLNTITTIPEQIAYLLMKGQPIELLDGDNEDIALTWVKEILRNVTREREKLRVFVVSIIGLQSSGKSTLMNSLFACRFPVSVGSCSRGLMMRMLFLDEELAKSHGFDAIVLIDTEGLGSPEKVNDRTAGKKDRLLSTFAMGISNLTLINVLGENTNELSEILQIALIAMTRLDEMGISPDILLVQHHLTEKNCQKTSHANVEFSTALCNAAELAERNVIQIGVRNVRCLDSVRERISKKAHLFPFHPYKDGATVNSPPSEGYHQDVVSLYKMILDFAKKSSSVATLDKWYLLVENVWNCAKQENFALRFKNIQEVHDFIERGRHITVVKRAVDSAFRSHLKKWEEGIAEHAIKKRQSTLPTDIESEVRSIPDECTCKLCKEAVKVNEKLSEFVKDHIFKDETAATIATHTDNARQNMQKRLQHMLNSSLMRQGDLEQIDSFINERVSIHLKDNSVSHTDSKIIKATATTIFEEVLDRVRSDETKHGDFKTRLNKLVKNEYEMSPTFVQKFERELNFDHLCDLSSGKLNDVIKKTSLTARATRMGRSSHESFFSHKPTEILKNHFNRSKPATTQLRTRIESLASIVFKKAEIFEEGMIGEVKQKIEQAIKTYIIEARAYDLHPETKTNIHIYAQQRFCAHAVKLQTEWEKQNTISGMMEEKGLHYKAIIENKVRNDATALGDGKMYALQLLNSIRMKAIHDENGEVYNIITRISWMETSENVRIVYFKELVLEVLQGKKERALLHFGNPKRCLEEWFKDTVDGYYREQCGIAFRRSFERRFTLLNDLLQSTLSMGSLDDVVTSFASSNVVGLTHFEYREYDFNSLKDAVIDTMNKDKDSWYKTTEDDFRFPSQNNEVMALLGCTDQCSCCGALCYGERDHVDNIDETRKHFTSHQPCGLDGRFFGENRRISAVQCHNLDDNEMLYISSYRHTGISWGDAKEKLYSDWKFDRHCDSKFDELMRWFFRELQKDIAANDSLQPATAEDLQICQCENLNLQQIMQHMDNQLN